MKTKLQHKKTISLFCIDEKKIENNQFLSSEQKLFLEQSNFSAKEGGLIALPNNKGEFGGYGFGMGKKEKRHPLILGLAASKLPSGKYKLVGNFDDINKAALAFNLGAYRFDKYKKQNGKVELELPKNADKGEIERLTKAAFIARDLINEGANILNPQEFENYAANFAKQHKMQFNSIVGDELLEQNFPLIHAVGKASNIAPRLVELRWGNKNHPKITLIGKGVCFDSGGLNLKHATGMMLMKKDMGGAANVLGLAHAIIDAKLKVNLRILLPMVENAVSGNSFRPSDILPSRLGLNVEIGNTDAEGRLILADALALADEEKPEMIIDIATLTGAARIALGPDLPAIFSTDNEWQNKILTKGEYWGDDLWPMPFFAPYEEKLASKAADINNIAPGFNFAGAIIAALFLKKFVKNTKLFTHLDIFGWSPSLAPGRPAGGTDQGIRALYFALKDRFGAV